MANPIAIVGQTAALTVLKEGFNLCQSILVYRQQAQQIELAREQMHAHANLQMAEIEHQFAKDMALLDTMSRGFGITLKQISKQSKGKAKLIKSVEQQIMMTLQMIASPTTPNDIRVGLNQTLQMITTQQAALINDFIGQNDSAVNAFAIFADGVRTSPRTFTDVR